MCVSCVGGGDVGVMCVLCVWGGDVGVMCVSCVGAGDVLADTTQPAGSVSRQARQVRRSPEYSGQ